MHSAVFFLCVFLTEIVEAGQTPESCEETLGDLAKVFELSDSTPKDIQAFLHNHGPDAFTKPYKVPGLVSDVIPPATQEAVHDQMELANGSPLYSVSFKLMNGTNIEGRIIGFEDAIEQTKKDQKFRYYYRVRNRKGGTEWIYPGDINRESFRLKVDPVTTPSLKIHLSELAAKAGIPYLKTQTASVSSLGYILRSGKIYRRKPDFEGGAGRTAIYMELGNAGMEGKKIGGYTQDIEWIGGKVRPILLFDTSLLDRKDYYINTGWKFGVAWPDSVSIENEPVMRDFLWRYGQAPNGGNEVCLLGPIPLTGLKRVLVPVGKKSEVVADLIAAGVVEFNGHPIKDLIEEANEWPGPMQ